jgi:hypothetical protein
MKAFIEEVELGILRLRNQSRTFGSISHLILTYIFVQSIARCE